MTEAKHRFETESDSTITVLFGPPGDANDIPRPSITIGYWSIRGLGAPIRMMLCAAKKDFICRMYDAKEAPDGAWRSRYRDEYKSDLLRYTSFMNLPYLVDEDEHLFLTQSNACLQYIGDAVGMMGKDKNRHAVCIQFLCEIHDLRNVMVGFAYGGSPDKASSTVAEANKYFQKFDLYLRTKELKTFLVGDSCTAPDFHLFEMIDQFSHLCQFYGLDDFLLGFPFLRTFFISFSKLEYVAMHLRFRRSFTL
jgi:glutathione S-transferase